MMEERISIHAPTRGATAQTAHGIRIRIYFNPRSHKGSDRQCRIKRAENLRFQSTLPQGERPLDQQHLCICVHNFNPRSHKGSDCFQVFCIPTEEIFQSTLPQGERRPLCGRKPLLFKISIHAPTRGATCPLMLARKGQKISIHAPTRGATSATR